MYSIRNDEPVARPFESLFLLLSLCYICSNKGFLIRSLYGYFALFLIRVLVGEAFREIYLLYHSVVFIIGAGRS